MMVTNDDVVRTILRAQTGAGEAAQSTRYLLHVHEDLSSGKKPGMAVYIGHLGARVEEGETGGFQSRQIAEIQSL